MNPPLRLLVTFQQAFQIDMPDRVLCAAGRDMWVAGNPIDNGVFTVHAPDLGGKVVFNYASATQKFTVANRTLPRWGHYLSGILLELCKQGIQPSGCKVVIAGEEPPGPRYEHAVGMAFAAFWYEVNNISYDVTHLRKLVDQVQRDYVEK